MRRMAPQFTWSSFAAALVAGLPFGPLVWHIGLAQNSRAGPVTGVIDAVAFEGDQYYVHGWACQEGQRGSIDVHLYAGGFAGGQPPGTFVLDGPANLPNEPAVDHECHDA